METYPLSALEALEAGALHALREAAADPKRPPVLASSDPALACLQRLAQKAFAPDRVPFALRKDAGATGLFPLAEWSEQDLSSYLAGEKVAADLLRVVIAGDGASALAQALRRDFGSARRRLQVSAAPGGDAHLRALVAGAASAELAVLVVDAKAGLTIAAKRDAFVCSLLGIPRVVVAMSKVDDRVRADFEDFAARLSFRSITFVPSESAALAAHLESVYIGGDRNLVDFRFPVQGVARDGAARWYLGRVASGVVKAGDEVVVLPSHRRTRVRALRLGEQALDYAYAPLSVALSLEDDIDTGRGAVLAHARNVPRAARAFDAMVVWMDSAPLAAGKVYLLEQGAHRVRASCAEVNYRMDADSLHRSRGRELGAGDIGRAAFTLFEERFVDPYAKNRATGGFTIVDADSGRTLGSGMIVDRETDATRVKPGEAAKRVVIPHASKVTTAHRAELLGQRSVSIWLTGLSGSGKSTLATELEKRLMGEGRACYMLDGDNVRAGINRDLGFGPDDRRENIRRIAEVAKLMNDAGLIAVTAFISPYRADRDMARDIIGAERFIEVFVDAPLEVCEGRDPKGLYRKARKGEIPEFTGVSAPYEAPAAPALSVHTATRSIGQCVDDLLALVLQRSRR